MTKEKFQQYNGLLHCLTCDRDVEKIHIDYKRVHDNGEILRCNVCDWIRKHPDKLTHELFTEQEIKEVLYFYFYDNFPYLNNMTDKLNRSIDDLIVLHKFLKIGNKKTLIKTLCEKCGKECDFTPHAFLVSKYHYCSNECYYKDKSSKMPKGKDNPCYNRIETSCTNCGKEIFVIPFQNNITNKDNQSNNFCCQQCYWDFRSKYYRGDNWTGSREKTNEFRKKMRLATAKRLQNEPIRVNTTIQLLVNNILDNLNEIYEREYPMKYYSIDNYLTNRNLAIEVMGDYWHANPLIYNKNNRLINNTQYKDIIIDKKKHTYVSRYKSIEILYLWESDIKNNEELCKELIELYIKNNGILDNYQSFNYHIENNKIYLNDSIIYPYFLLNKKYTQSILKSNVECA